MKNLLITVFLISTFSVPLMAQNQDTTSWAYAEILGYSKLFSKKVNVTIDYGQASKFFQNDFIVDKDGNVVSFNSMVDAMNSMGHNGWEFVQAFVVTESGGMTAQNVYHWILKRPAKIDENGNYIPLTRNEFKKSQVKKE